MKNSIGQYDVSECMHTRADTAENITRWKPDSKRLRKHRSDKIIKKNYLDDWGRQRRRNIGTLLMRRWTLMVFNEHEEKTIYKHNV